MKFLANISIKLLIIVGLTMPFSPILAKEVDLTFTELSTEILNNTEVLVEWTTTESAMYVFEYGPTTTYGNTLRGSNSSKQQQVVLRNLEPEKTYHFRVIAFTPADDRTVSFDQTFKTKKELDTEKPELITFRMPLVTKNAAYFHLQTNEKTKATITYWPEDKPNNKKKKTVATRNEHWAHGTITHLQPNTTYRYTLEIRDVKGNAISIQEKSFTTEKASFILNQFAIENITPIDLNSPDITADSATIRFTTTLPAQCQIASRAKNSYKQTRMSELYYKEWQHAFTFQDLKPGTTYEYKISCTDFLLKKKSTEWITFTTRGPVVLGYSMTQTSKIEKTFATEKKFTLMRATGDDKIYVVIKNQKYHIKNPSIFASYNLHNTPIQTVSPEKLVTYADAKVIQSQSGEKYYLYLDKNRKKKIPNEKVNRSYDTNKKYEPIKVSDIDLQSYEDITLVKTADSPTVYYIYANGTKRPIASWNVFIQRGWQPWEIGIINQTDLDSYITSYPIQ